MKFSSELYKIIAAFLVFAPCALDAQVPQWAVTHSHPNIPASEFILGVGYGTGEKADETAKRLAQSDIATQVRVRVQTEVKNVQQTYELNQNQETYSDFRIKSTSIVDEQLTGAEIVETAIDRSTNTSYALAALNKEKFAVSIAAELTAGWNQARELRSAAEAFLHQGKLNEAVQSLIEGRSTVFNLLPREALHDAVARAPFAGDPSLGPSALTSAIRDALSNVKIEKKSGDKQKGKIGEKFAEPFVVHVGVFTGEKNVPVVGAGVAFLPASGEALGEAVTDGSGDAALSISARKSIGAHIRVRLSLQSLGTEFVTNINASSTTFDCAFLDADAAFSVKMETRTGVMNEALRSVVADAVTHVGYHVVDMSRYVLRVGCQNAPPTTIEGMVGTLFSVSSDVTIVLIDKESARTLGSVILKSKGVAKTQEGALEKSARDLKIDEQILIELLEKAKN